MFYRLLRRSGMAVLVALMAFEAGAQISGSPPMSPPPVQGIGSGGGAAPPASGTPSPGAPSVTPIGIPREVVPATPTKETPAPESDKAKTR
ncbi:MAG: hypothetical protein J0J01_05675 [Reyranella sp.]|uniref:hypothetical protein n=1 Tax=Reyranella sp. TaxID=1929291 RepID=UPI001AD2DFD5|nr:hypothetical protein [Reyranella sp.]MBN9086377.1 hypothetical protein [Reyranella sp.]